MGITGLDIIGESGSDIERLMSLDFGHCRLCLMAPKGSVRQASELSGKRIVTSFPNLTRRYFNQFDTPERKTTITYVSGSVEAACGLGLGDGIVDLVETGTTMEAAGLEVVDKVMDTETVLISNKHSKHHEIVTKIVKRLQGYLLAQQYTLLMYNIEKKIWRRPSYSPRT